MFYLGHRVSRAIPKFVLLSLTSELNDAKIDEPFYAQWQIGQMQCIRFLRNLIKLVVLFPVRPLRLASYV